MSIILGPSGNRSGVVVIGSGGRSTGTIGSTGRNEGFSGSGNRGNGTLGGSGRGIYIGSGG